MQNKPYFFSQTWGSQTGGRGGSPTWEKFPHFPVFFWGGGVPNSSFGLNILGPLCLWQCLEKRFGLIQFFVEDLTNVEIKTKKILLFFPGSEHFQKLAENVMYNIHFRRGNTALRGSSWRLARDNSVGRLKSAAQKSLPKVSNHTIKDSRMWIRIEDQGVSLFLLYIYTTGCLF